MIISAQSSHRFRASASTEISSDSAKTTATTNDIIKWSKKHDELQNMFFTRTIAPIFAEKNSPVRQLSYWCSGMPVPVSRRVVFSLLTQMTFVSAMLWHWMRNGRWAQRQSTPIFPHANAQFYCEWNGQLISYLNFVKSSESQMSNVAIMSSPFLHLSTLRMHISLCKHRVFRPCSFRSTTKFPSGSSHYKPLVHPNRPCTHLARLDCSCIHSHRLETDPKSKPMRHIRHRRSLSSRDNAFYSFSVSFGWYSLDPVALGT